MKTKYILSINLIYKNKAIEGNRWELELTEDIKVPLSSAAISDINEWQIYQNHPFFATSLFVMSPAAHEYLSNETVQNTTMCFNVAELKLTADWLSVELAEFWNVLRHVDKLSDIGTESVWDFTCSKMTLILSTSQSMR